MARAAAALFDSHIGLATTGYAEPPDTIDQLSFAYFAVYDRRIADQRQSLVRAGRMSSRGRDRKSTQQLYAENVIEELLSYLTEKMASKRGGRS
jgi:nicotinamide mononucleotide (NMN) deamidase PncC